MLSRSVFSIKRPPSLIVLCAVASLIGFLSICIPSLLRAEIILSAPLFPWLATAVNTVTPLSYVLLFAVGYGLGQFNSERPWLLGLSTVAFFPVLAIFEKSIVITTHPYFALEFLFYLCLGLSAVAGVYLVRFIR